jgi:PadR family transcriptional regulator, regulatory protein PadR
MADPDGKHWGYSLMQRSGVRSGVLYPILQRLLAEQWISDGWEDPATVEKRPPRRYYQLTDRGKLELGALVVGVRSGAQFDTTNPGWAQ